MYAHHAATIERLKTAYENEPFALAVVVGGSVMKGWAAENSDVDFMLVAEEPYYQEAFANGQVTIFRTDLTEYEGGYVDGKIVPLSFIQSVAEKGSETARSAFLGARVLFDRTGEVWPLVETILRYPEEGVEDRILRFHSHLMIWGWYTGEAAKRNDPYLMAKSVSEIGLYAMRLILAENRRLYPYHKWVTQMVRETPNKPEGIIEKIHAMIQTQTPEAIQDVIETMNAWGKYEIDWRRHCQHFLEESEWNWVDHLAPLADR